MATLTLTNRPWVEIASTILLPHEASDKKQTSSSDSGICLVSLLRCPGPHADVLVVLCKSSEDLSECDKNDLDGLGDLLGISAEEAQAALRSGILAHSALLQSVHGVVLGYFYFIFEKK